MRRHNEQQAVETLIQFSIPRIPLHVSVRLAF